MRGVLQAYFNFIKRLLPDQTPDVTVGLDVGTGDCKLVQLRKTAGQYELLAALVEPIKNGNITETVRSLLASLPAPSKRVHVAVFGKGTLIRYIHMPKMALADLKNSFTLEADKYFPFSRDQIYTDCYILQEEEDSPQMAVLAAAVKRELVDQKVQLLQDLGITPEFIGLNAIALANIIHVVGDPTGFSESAGALAILDMGESVSNVMIMKDRLPWFTRDIFIGGREFTKRISNALGVSFEEAEALKKSPGDFRDKVLESYESALLNMVRELRLSFDYFATERNTEVKRLLLTGGGAMLDGIAAMLSRNLEMEVQTWNPLSVLTRAEGISDEDCQKKALKLGVALGLALYN